MDDDSKKHELLSSKVRQKKGKKSVTDVLCPFVSNWNLILLGTLRDCIGDTPEVIPLQDEGDRIFK